MACLIIVSSLAQICQGLGYLWSGRVTRSTKARFDQVGDQVSQVKDHVGQGKGQELDNNEKWSTPLSQIQ